MNQTAVAVVETRIALSQKAMQIVTSWFDPKLL
jgi:hypothetical protein